jgi:hypothetical protein
MRWFVQLGIVEGVNRDGVKMCYRGMTALIW